MTNQAARREGSTRMVVTDAGPLIHLDELGCLELLADFSEVRVPEAVWREVEHHRPLALYKIRKFRSSDACRWHRKGSML